MLSIVKWSMIGQCTFEELSALMHDKHNWVAVIE